MGNLLFKPTAGGALIIQNNGAGAKIQLNNDDTIDITGPIASATFPAGHTLKWAQYFAPEDVTETSASYENIISTTFTPTKNNSIVYAYAYLYLNSTTTTAISDNRKVIGIDITGDDITNVEKNANWGVDYYGNFAVVNYGHDGVYIALPAVTLDGTGTAAITYVVKMKNENLHAGNSWTAFGDGATESSITFTEVSG